jgi:1,4-alpha-glucan branching enzyme
MHYTERKKSLYECQYVQEGFEWIDINDNINSVISFIRRSCSNDELIVVVCNFTPVPRYNYHIGVPLSGKWTELFNSDDKEFGGSNVRNIPELEALEQPFMTNHLLCPLHCPPWERSI